MQTTVVDCRYGDTYICDLLVVIDDTGRTFVCKPQTKLIMEILSNSEIYEDPMFESLDLLRTYDSPIQIDEEETLLKMVEHFINLETTITFRCQTVQTIEISLNLDKSELEEYRKIYGSDAMAFLRKRQGRWANQPHFDQRHYDIKT